MQWRHVVNTAVTLFIVLLYTKFFDWWWEAMPKYLFEASYTLDGARGVIKDGGTKRRAAVEAVLKSLIENHARYTGSKRAVDILGNWASYRAKFIKVFPKEYRRALGPRQSLPLVIHENQGELVRRRRRAGHWAASPCGSGSSA